MLTSSRDRFKQYLDSCGIFKDAVLSILATIAKQERIRLSERTMAGLEKARKRLTAARNTPMVACRLPKEGLAFDFVQE